MTKLKSINILLSVSIILTLIVAVSCRRDPSISVNHESFDCVTEGGTFNININADHPWKVSCPEGVEVYPSSASGNSPVSITVLENETGSARDLEVLFTCTGNGVSSIAQVTVHQQYVEVLPTLNIDTLYRDYDFDGGWLKLSVDANYKWTARLEAPKGYKVSISKEEGAAGGDSLTVTMDRNTLEKAFDLQLFITAAGKRGHTADDTVTLHITEPYCEKGGTFYDLKYMKDGRWWMAENLRYLPDGASPSADYTSAPYGIWYPVELSTVKLTTDESTIESQGYLYNAEAAFGLPQGTLTRDNYMNYEGVQGLCPDGWHIPTADEYLHLIGYIAGLDLCNDAPYLDKSANKCYISALNADGFNIPETTWGMVSVTTKFNVNAIMSYIWGSTGKGGEKGFYDATTTLPAYGFFKSLMPAKTLRTCNGADAKSIMGGVIRCIKNVKVSPESEQ